MKAAATIRLLIFSIGFTMLLVVFRIFYSERLMYIFFAWNLFLACVPFVISLIIVRVEKKYFQWILFAGWLLFFPNTLYIVTDLLHLKERYPVPLWFDVVLIFSAAINRLILAFISMQYIEIFLKLNFNKSKTAMILSGCLLLGSFGVYLGRFLRWNSWDILSNPSGLGYEIMQRFLNPLEHPRTWGLTIVLTLFFNIFYFAIKEISTFKYETNLV